MTIIKINDSTYFKNTMREDTNKKRGEEQEKEVKYDNQEKKGLKN